MQWAYSLHFRQVESIDVLKYPTSHSEHSDKEKQWLNKKTISLICCVQCCVIYLCTSRFEFKSNVTFASGIIGLVQGSKIPTALTFCVRVLCADLYGITPRFYKNKKSLLKTRLRLKNHPLHFIYFLFFSRTDKVNHMFYELIWYKVWAQNR